MNKSEILRLTNILRYISQKTNLSLDDILSKLEQYINNSKDDNFNMLSFTHDMLSPKYNIKYDDVQVLRSNVNAALRLFHMKQDIIHLDTSDLTMIANMLISVDLYIDPRNMFDGIFNKRSKDQLDIAWDLANKFGDSEELKNISLYHFFDLASNAGFRYSETGEFNDISTALKNWIKHPSKRASIKQSENDFNLIRDNLINNIISTCNTNDIAMDNITWNNCKDSNYNLFILNNNISYKTKRKIDNLAYRIKQHSDAKIKIILNDVEKQLFRLYLNTHSRYTSLLDLDVVQQLLK